METLRLVWDVVKEARAASQVLEYARTRGCDIELLKLCLVLQGAMVREAKRMWHDVTLFFEYTITGVNTTFE
ncbi:hypothetical protein NDU88_011301 [Pleurodeles waltl]|uniref:Uncharacterized protein n=1 Tax=Pleurodeles waltl TaxID=8319 RepID=A0AAV7Q0C6_PLEWA|nr:hypothetical protein NDU88_011301 [Pleurodeles waltl]